MTLFRDAYRAEPARLSNWNYSSAGSYFVTICACNHRCIFGEIINEKINLNGFGDSVADCTRQIPGHFKNVLLDEWVIMPNHVHAIIRLSHCGLSHCRDVACNVSTKNNPTIISGNNRNVSTKNNPTITSGNNRNVSAINKFNHMMAAISPKPNSLPAVIRSFKSAVTNRMHANGFRGNVWQSRFHDHIIRNDRELFAIRHYIKNNPACWENDRDVLETKGNLQGKQPWHVYLP